MATGDVTFFDEAKLNMLSGDWASTDTFKVAILDNSTAPTASDATPTLSDYTEVGTGGSYSAGGYTIGTYAAMTSEAGGTVTFDHANNPTWAQHASNDTDAYWGLLYNDTNGSDEALAFIDLGGPVDMSTGALTITWNASGIATLA